MEHGDGLWARAGNLLLGGWLIISALAWDITAPARTDALVVGYLVFVLSVVATLADGVRALNTVLGVWLVASTWIFPPQHALMRLNTVAVGVAIAALSLIGRRGRIRPLPLRTLLHELEPPNPHLR